MKCRTLTLLAAGFAAAALAIPAAAQTAKPAYMQPKTPWGDPDIQGMWPSAAMQGVPLQRPESFGERATLTDEEFKRRQQAVENARTGSFALGAWGEPGKAQRQASLIVDPKNGRLPAMTPEGV